MSKSLSNASLQSNWLKGTELTQIE
jgi:hypothetical protein